MNRPRFIVLLLVGLVALCLVPATPARADIAPRWSERELTALADVVLTGRVLGLSSSWDAEGRLIHTYVTVEVGRVLKGWVPEETVVLKILGGTVGDTSLVIGGSAEFGVGEEVLTFLSVRSRDRTLTPTAMWQGKWSIERDPASGSRMATRPDPIGDDWGIFGEPRRVRLLGPFLEELRSWAGEASRRPTGKSIVTHPAEAPPATGTSEDDGGAVSAPTHDDGEGEDSFFRFLEDGNGFASRWMRSDGGDFGPVTVDRGGTADFPDFDDELPGDGSAELDRSRQLWNGAGADFRWSGGGQTGNRCIHPALNGRAFVSYDDVCDDADNGGGVLAVGGFFATGSPTMEIGGHVFQRITAGFVILNTDDPGVENWLTHSRCHQDIVTHELGHVLGLGHAATAVAIMWRAIDSDCFSRSGSAAEKITGRLGTPDVNGIRFIYPPDGGDPDPDPGPGPDPGPDPDPGPGPTPVPGAPGNLVFWVQGSTVSMDWNKPRGGVAPTAYRIEAGSSSGASNLATLSPPGTRTDLTVNRVPAGTFFVRVRGINGSAAGDASNEVTIRVGAGQPSSCAAAPGAPEDLTFTLAGSRLTLNWKAPTTGDPPTSYVVEAGSSSGGSNQASFVTGGTARTVVAPNLPSGTYFIRVSALNACGSGPDSNEVEVVR